ncbi:MAG: hypothetical protein ABIL11_03190 [Chloroflexota bacterium]
MLTPSDLIRLPYTPDLTEGGIAYACCSLAYTYDRMGGTAFDRLRRIVGGVAWSWPFAAILRSRIFPSTCWARRPSPTPTATMSHSAGIAVT